MIALLAEAPVFGTLLGRFASRSARSPATRCAPRSPCLGIFIGITAVVIVTAAATSATDSIGGAIDSFAANALFVFPQPTQASGAQSKTVGRITEADGRAIAREAVSVSGVAPWLSTHGQVVYGDKNWSTTLIGTKLPYFPIRRYSIAQRRDLDGERRDSQDQGVPPRPDGRDEPLRQRGPRRSHHPHRPLAVHGHRRARAARARRSFGDDQDDRVMMPIGSFRARVMHTSPGRADQLIISATSDQTIEPRQGADRGHPAPAPPHRAGRDDFTVSSQAEFRETTDAHPRRAVASCARRRGHQPARRRHRRHEHHARERRRAHARDRHSHVDRRARARHPGPVSGRGRRPHDGRRGARHRRRQRRHDRPRRAARLADGAQRRRARDRGRDERRHRHGLRVPARAARGEARSRSPRCGWSEPMRALLDGIRLAFRAIVRNPLRASLTVLGILIGVAAVVTVTRSGRARASTSPSRSRRSARTSSSSSRSGRRRRARAARRGPGCASPRTTDARSCASRRASRAVAPALRATVQVVYGDQNWSTQVVGTTLSYLDGPKLDRRPAARRGTRTTRRRRRRWCVLGATVAQNLFGTEDPVGQHGPHRSLPVPRARRARAEGGGAVRRAIRTTSS